MLNGIDPVLIIQIGKVVPSEDSLLSKIPIISEIPTIIESPPIPIYLSENLTGIYIDSEDKNVDISTDVQTLTSGDQPQVNQKGIASTISINMVAKKSSLSLALLSSLMDLIFDKVTSKEYAVTYLHGPITIFRGVVQSYSVNQNASNELLTINLQLSKGNKQPQKTEGPPAVPGYEGPTPELQ